MDDAQREQTVRRIQATLPDRELIQPKLQRKTLSQIATTTGGSAWFPLGETLSETDTTKIVSMLKDRSRTEYEIGENDKAFKKTLNTLLLGIGIVLLSSEWILRRLAKLD